jgi:hypothetical protein
VESLTEQGEVGTVGDMQDLDIHVCGHSVMCPDELRGATGVCYSCHHRAPCTQVRSQTHASAAMVGVDSGSGGNVAGGRCTVCAKPFDEPAVVRVGALGGVERCGRFPGRHPVHVRASVGQVLDGGEASARTRRHPPCGRAASR